MPFRFTCPHCQLETLVDDQYEGQTGPCAGCGLTITVQRPVVRDRSDRKRRFGFDISIATMRAMVLTALASLILGTGVIWVLWVGVLPRVRAWQQLNATSSCKSRLARIGVALAAYQMDYGRFPPAVTYSADGKPMHSWRVLLLPYLGYPQLVSAYRFDEPWDSPNNQAVARIIPDEYRDVTSPGSSYTQFVALVGSNSAWSLLENAGLVRLREPRNQCVLVIEMAGSKIPWTAPLDADLSGLSYQINSTTSVSLRSAHSGGPHVLLLDGSVHQLRRDVPPHLVRSLLDAMDGQVLTTGSGLFEAP